MNVLHIRDLKNGTIQLTWQKGNELRPYGQPIPFAGPLSEDDRQELRWYLEAYLQFPYGAERERAQQVAERMQAWGEQLFKQVFIKAEEDPDPRAFYREAVRAGLETCELCISSDDPGFLNLPWELLYDSTPGRGYLAPNLAGLFRQRAKQALPAEASAAEDQPFRILLVIARPYDERDVPLGTVARPLLEAVRGLRPQVELDILRPPTFEALAETLREKRGYYQLVHFDGHGAFGDVETRRRGDAEKERYAETVNSPVQKGHLVFETADGQPDLVSSQALGQALATARVPLFVLNACQSAEEAAGDPFASVAAQLVAVGAKGVVAMSYAVYASTAAKFIGRFYERIIQHTTLSEAVAAGRLALYTDAARPSVVGPLELADWIVPSLYQQESQYVPIPEGAVKAKTVDDRDRPVAVQQASQVCPEGRFGFIGRDYDLLQIERAFQKTNYLLVSGMGGSGKSELAYGFGRWYAETGGCPGGVFVSSFKEKASLGQVIGDIAGFGTDFSSLPEQQQWDILVDYLRKNACLLIWDNFETVAGYPSPTEALATEAEREKLARFLRALRGGKSKVLITTRKPEEDWLGVAYQLIELGGLNKRDAAELAEGILAMVGRKPEDFQDQPDYAQLIWLLQGHPRALELVLPRLRKQAPAKVLDELQHETDVEAGVLDASLAYAFNHLSERARKHLPFAGLFAPYVYLYVLASFVCSGQTWEVAYREVMGEALDRKGWEGVFDEAAGAGLLHKLQEGLYELHPTLPVFLRGRLAEAVGEAGYRRLDREYATFYAELAGYLLDDVRQGSQNVMPLLAVEEGNLLRAARILEREPGWSELQGIAQILYEWYSIRERRAEYRVLRQRLLLRTGREMDPGADKDQASLWMFLLSDEANDHMERNDLPAAQAIHETVLRYLLAVSDPDQEDRVANVYQQMGNVAEGGHQFEQAEDWYHKALEINERLGRERRNMMVYHQLGIIAQERQQYEQAEEWYRKALAISERLGLDRDAAMVYHELGRVVGKRKQYEQAEEWYHKALVIEERLGLERQAATDYHQLGWLAEGRQQFDNAEDWYRKALAIYERLGLERDAADDYMGLGAVVLARRQLDQAEAWYRKALATYERLGHPLKANALAAMGRLYMAKGQSGEAIAWCVQALEVAMQYQMPVGGLILRNLAWILKETGEQEFATAWEKAQPGVQPPLDELNRILAEMEGKT